MDGPRDWIFTNRSQKIIIISSASRFWKLLANNLVSSISWSLDILNFDQPQPEGSINSYFSSGVHFDKSRRFQRLLALNLFPIFHTKFGFE